MTLEIATNAKCKDLDGVQVFVGDLKKLTLDAPSAVGTECAKDGRIGSLVLAPGSVREFGILVAVGVGQDTATCLSNGFQGGCIVAKRALGFIDHHPLTLPIELEIECLNIPCEASETCRKGQCYSATLPDPGSCNDPVECGKPRPPTGTGGLATGGAMSGGTGGATGGSATGGTVTGGAATGGSMAVCGNSKKEVGESCDDGNTVDADGCSAQCWSESLLVSDLAAKKLIRYSYLDGSFIADLATEATTTLNFAPTAFVQVPSGDLFVSDSGGRILNLDRSGKLVAEHPVTVNLGVAATSTHLLVGEDSTGIARYKWSDFSKDTNFASTMAWGLEAIDDRWVLTANVGFGEVYLVDGTAQNADQVLYAGGSVFDITQLPDGRILVPDTFNDTVSELVPNKPITPANPVGLPVSAGRSVTTTAPYGAIELLNGNWFVVSDTGAEIFDPATGLSVGVVSTSGLRAVELYRGL